MSGLSDLDTADLEQHGCSVTPGVKTHSSFLGRLRGARQAGAQGRCGSVWQAKLPVSLR